MSEPWDAFCPECGHACVDEDGCCCVCGRDAYPIPRATAELLARVAELEGKLAASQAALVEIRDNPYASAHQVAALALEATGARETRILRAAEKVRMDCIEDVEPRVPAAAARLSCCNQGGTFGCPLDKQGARC